MRLDPEPAAAPLEFQARVTTTGNRPTVVVRGEVDRATVAEFTAALDTAIRLGSSIELDPSEMTFIDSAGLTALVTAQLRRGHAVVRAAAAADVAGPDHHLRLRRRTP